MVEKGNPTGKGGVGYKNPPKGHRFKPGQSGNPRGRPKGTRNLKADLLEELAEQMTIREGNRERRLSKQRALVKTLVARALNGNDGAAAKVIDLYLKVAGLELDAADADLPLTQDESAVINSLEERLLRRATLAARKTRDPSPVNDDDCGEAS